MYTLVKFTTLDHLSSGHIFQFSQWMKDSTERPDAVFIVCKSIVEYQHKNLQFYAIVSGSETVGYLAHSLGENSVRFSRINYFAIDPKERNKGTGTNVMKFLLERLLMPSDITSIACHSSLRPFYERCGFSYIGLADDGNDLMFYSQQEIAIDNIAALREEPVTQLGYDGSFKQEYKKLETRLLR